MQLIDLETAVDHIRHACEDSCEEGRSPFFFLVGAGISYPPIPLATKIVEDCKQRCKKTTEPSGKQPIDIYSHWFHQAHPQPAQRQIYLKNLIKGKPISHANLRLAHLLLEKTITNLVVTPNFDDFLSRALTLFGKPHIVCDHPHTVGRIHPERDDIQIVHVHGTYWFYDCCNLRGEIEARSQSSAQTIMTTAALLDRILWNRSPLVIGYSGWEGDVIMTALRRRLESQNPLPYNLYWFCYRRTEVDTLSKYDWLKNNQQVYFVVPPPQEPSRQAVDELSERETHEKRQIKPSPTAKAKGFLVKESDEPKLYAQKVLERLIRAFHPKDPELTTDPLGFFAKHLHDSLILEDVGEERSDIYSISSVIDRIRQANKNYTETIPEIESKLESVRVAMRRSRYREAVKLAIKIEKNNLTPTQLREFMGKMWSASLGLYDNSREELHGYDLVITAGEMLLKQNEDEPALREEVAMALFNKGVTLGSLNQSKEAIAVYDEVVRRF
ncbi:MAG TPA: SIR2 family protein, partial [Candidatus Wunengus californicus]|uniref:SIR2 family protein n=1 Tax=Candidatus Wunengus californicus TaxID=3367619 RepID=UPI0040294D91